MSAGEEWPPPARAAGAFEEPLQERREPALGIEGRQRNEPHQPIEAEVVRRNLAAESGWVARLRSEAVLAPAMLVTRIAAGALDHDLIARAPDGAEGAVGIDEVKRIERGVHRLTRTC